MRKLVLLMVGLALLVLVASGCGSSSGASGGGIFAATGQSSSGTSASDPGVSTSDTGSATTPDVPGYTNPEDPAAKAIPGVIYKPEPEHNHIEGVLQYDTTPPTGGNHSQYWADCSGTVYPAAIANENAVHMLEHGAVWITYQPGLAADQVAILAKLVSGIDRMAMSPYPDLRTPISLQAWDYQLFVNSADDPRIAEFIAALRFNPNTTPEPSATCSQPTFVAHPSTFGDPLWVPAE